MAPGGTKVGVVPAMRVRTYSTSSVLLLGG
jgi:hypothetical protein